MAAPNIVNVANIYAKTTYLTPAVTTAVVLLANPAASSKVLKVNQVQNRAQWCKMLIFLK